MPLFGTPVNPYTELALILMPSWRTLYSALRMRSGAFFIKPLTNDRCLSSASNRRGMTPSRTCLRTYVCPAGHVSTSLGSQSGTFEGGTYVVVHVLCAMPV